jgi:dCMP deaminase
MKKWHKRYFNMAIETASWSKDPSAKIGAVIVGANGQIISQGYNGFARGITDSEERYNDRETKYKYVIHAELNAIFNAAANGASTKGTDMYVYGLCVCHLCADAIIQSGIANVYCLAKPNPRWKESAELAKDKFKETEKVSYTIYEDKE